MNKRIISLLRSINSYGTLPAAILSFFNAFYLLLFFLLHGLGLLGVLFAILFLFFGSIFLWSHWKSKDVANP